MTCSVCARGRETDEPKKVQAGRPRAASPAVTGTWDFKWARGKRIRVAFQRAEDEPEFDAAVAEVKRLAERWTDKLGAGFSAIKLEFPAGWILDPPLGAEALTGSTHRSAYLPSEVSEIDYDVLISLRRLPVTITDPFDPEQKSVEFALPYSELGCYARRADYGQPTAFLGCPFADVSLTEFLASNAGAHVVVHEFGHILGLAHSHQNRLYEERPYRKPEELKEILSVGFDLKKHQITSGFVEQHLIKPWPSSIEFSDWLTPKRGLSELASVMAHPFHASLLRSSTESPAELGARLNHALRASEKSAAHPDILTWPTDTDIAQLRKMYP